MKNVQIPYDLFVALVQYHLMENDGCTDTIRQGLEKKLDSLYMNCMQGQKQRLQEKSGKKPDRNIWTGVELVAAFAGSFSVYNRQERGTFLWIADKEKNGIR